VGSWASNTCFWNNLNPSVLVIRWRKLFGFAALCLAKTYQNSAETLWSALQEKSIILRHVI
jgi:hypothetical protein